MKFFSYLLIYIISSISIANANQPKGIINNKINFNNYNSRSDTFDISEYKIHLNITDFVGKTISGNCEIKAISKLNNTSSIIFDLQQLSVDSIFINGLQNTNYSQVNNFLKINFSNFISQNDTLNFNIYYHGVPFAITNGFGGFYFTNGIAFNMGVGIGVDPPNFGRVWFPCFDNFVQRSSYEFFITTKINHKAFCNGNLLSNTIDSINQTNNWHYKLNETIPTYLACVAVGPYATIHQTFTGVNGNMPVEIAALASDTTLVKNCFTNLENAFDYFEDSFGPYRWEKVGYSIVPFNSGAMEHATNISYPRPFIDNAGTYEADLMAHELAHHWFGDLVTCQDAGDMWLNEGWATFSGLLFLEKLHDTATYINAVKEKLDDVLHFAHYKEDIYQALSPIPEEFTYGTHVYDKGALVAHTLRAYLGSDFFTAITSYMNNNQFQKTSSFYFRDQLELYSNKNLHPFFNNNVFDGGFSHFSVDSFSVIPIGSSYQTKVYVKQKLTGTSAMHTRVPLDFSFYDSNSNKIVLTDTINSQNSIHNFSIPIHPKFILVNQSQRLCTAQLLEEKKITANGTYPFSMGKLTTTISNFSADFNLFIEHNYTKPDDFKNNSKYRLSPNRYWKVSGIIPAGTNVKATFKYNGKTTSFSGDNYLDNLLINDTEDSLFLFYRIDAGSDWSIVTDTTWFRGNKLDKVGNMNVANLKIGEYSFAMKDEFAAINSAADKDDFIQIFPNPALDNLNIVAPNYKKVDFVDLNGRIINSIELINYNSDYNISDLKKGMYILKFTGLSNTTFRKLMIE